jgi:hypothetical protein
MTARGFRDAEHSSVSGPYDSRSEPVAMLQGKDMGVKIRYPLIGRKVTTVACDVAADDTPDRLVQLLRRLRLTRARGVTTAL